jgi:hypothetical protein
MSAMINDIRDTKPEIMLGVILFEEHVKTLKKPGTDGIYKTSPLSLTKELASCTARRSGWSLLEDKRISWWRTFLENVRHVRQNESGGLKGGDNPKIKTCLAYYLDESTKDDARKIAYRAFYKTEKIDTRVNILKKMNCATDEEIEEADNYITLHGMAHPSYTDTGDSESATTIQVSDTENADIALQISEENPDYWEGDLGEIGSPSWAQYISAPVAPPSSGPIFSANSLSSLPHNRILYGAPGTGKSYKLEQDKTSISGSFERVTFHPEYGYADFIGVYRPLPIFSSDGVEYCYDGGAKVETKGTPHVIYQFEPGIFIKILKRSYDSLRNNDSLTHLLIIEEINRSNMSATFGEIFQLLDRDDNGNSEYEISMREEILRYLSADGEPILTKIRIPGNLYLWATMNTTDDGVYSMDSAFKRRWSFEHVPIDDGESVVDTWMLPSSITWLNGISWNEFRKSINAALISQTGQFREDQLLGPFFFKKTELSGSNLFKNKLLDYLHQQVLRHNPSVLFEEKYTSASFSKLMKDFDNVDVFKDGIIPVSEEE